MAAADTIAPVLTSLLFPSSVDVTTGGKSITFTAGATDQGLGVNRVTVIFSKRWQDTYGNTSAFESFDSTDPFSDGQSSRQYFIDSKSGSGTYNISNVYVYDKAGNYTTYSASQLAQMGIQNSFSITSSSQTDTTAPVLTSLTFPSSVDVTTGGKSITFTAGATDQGLGVNRVTVIFSKSWQDTYGNTSAFESFDSTDSFSDGQSSRQYFIDSKSGSGTYNINNVYVYDKAGNYTTYSASQLTQMDIQNSFSIIDSAAPTSPTVIVAGPASVNENAKTFDLSLTLKNVTTASGTVSFSFDTPGSTATNGVDVSVPTSSLSYSVSQTPSGDYRIVLPSITIIDDTLVEATETVAIRIKAPGQRFDNGTDETVVSVSIIDNDSNLPMTISGSTGNDSLTGTTGADIFYSGGGRDTLAGLGGNDTYRIDSPDTVIRENANEGTDTAIVTAAAGLASYTLNADAQVEIVSAETGSAKINITGNGFSQVINGNDGANILSTGGGAPDTLNGGLGDDVYRVFSTGDVIEDSGGFDTVYASGTSYFLYSTASVEYLSTSEQAGTQGFYMVGNGASQVIVGNYGDNTINGRGGDGVLLPDTLIGLFGNDTYGVFSQGDVVREVDGQGTDVVYTNASYQLRSGTSIEILSAVDQSATGAASAYTLRGNAFAQTVAGNGADNVIDGRGGNDTLVGLGGADVFAFTTALDGTNNVDTIRDFAGGADRIGLATDIFAAVTDGGITAGEFVVGTAAADADDRLVYDQTTGRLWYDADGNGAGAQVLFAQLAAGTTLTAASFTPIAPVAELAAA